MDFLFHVLTIKCVVEKITGQLADKSFHSLSFLRKDFHNGPPRIYNNGNSAGKLRLMLTQQNKFY